MNVDVDVTAIPLCPNIDTNACPRVLLFSDHRVNLFNHPGPSVFHHDLGRRGRCGGSCRYRRRSLLTACHSD
jgi:hypothetical protein